MIMAPLSSALTDSNGVNPVTTEENPIQSEIGLLKWKWTQNQWYQDDFSWWYDVVTSLM